MITHFSALLHRYIRYTVSKSRLQMVQGVYREPKRETFLFIRITNTAAMNTIFKSLRSIILLIMLMLLMPLLSFAAETIRVNIPRVTVTMARSYNFTSAANSVYVPVEFNSAMSADKVADYIEESNAFLFDHYGEYVVERNDYYPMGMRTATGNGYPQLATNLYKYNGKEVQTIGNLGFTDYGARMYDDFTGRWFVPDPLAEKYASMSPYMYCGGNPINAIDVDGRSTWVVRAGKGKYEVVGGNLYDNDRNIYVGTLDKKNNKFTREYSIGITTSITSFYYCDAKEGPKWSEESIIDVNDRSGYEFLKKIMSQIPPMIDDYMLNARTGHRYDFKVTNGTDHEIEGIDIYRGMPVGVTDKGQVIFSSARDIGNIAAGFIAGVNGMPWIPSRLAFDFYQGGIEGISTRNAEFYGWQLGYYNTSATQKRDNLMNSLGSAVMSLFKSFKNKKK